MSAEEESLARIPAAERTARRLVGNTLQILSCPFQDGHSGRTLCPGSKPDFHFQTENKQTGGFTWPRTAFSRDGLRSPSGGSLRAPTTETVWEPVLKSPEQVRNYFSCSPFRSKIKTSSRNKHMLLCIYF